MRHFPSPYCTAVGGHIPTESLPSNSFFWPEPATEMEGDSSRHAPRSEAFPTQSVGETSEFDAISPKAPAIAAWADFGGLDPPEFSRVDRRSFPAAPPWRGRRRSQRSA